MPGKCFPWRFVCMLDLLNCLISLFEFIGIFSMLASFPLICLNTTCLAMLVLLLVCIVSIGVRSLYAIVGCALSARGSSLKAASLATTPVVHRVLCRQKPLRAVRSPPRRPNIEGPFLLCCAVPFNPPGPAVLDRP